jgi:hypothetical protein
LKKIEKLSLLNLFRKNIMPFFCMEPWTSPSFWVYKACV